MEIITNKHSSRRNFLTKVIPACSFMCFGAGKISALIASDKEPVVSQDSHIFNQEFSFGRKMTFKQYYNRRFNNKFIPILQEISREIGEEKFLKILKNASYEANRKLGQRIAKRLKVDDVSFFARAFLNPGVDFKHSLIYEIIENSNKVFAVKITECLTEFTFREANALKIGYASVCHADFGFPKGLNPKIKLIRDKTLMQGHNCCNHRYILTG